jgi:hypothetical protein
MSQWKPKPEWMYGRYYAHNGHLAKLQCEVPRLTDQEKRDYLPELLFVAAKAGHVKIVEWLRAFDSELRLSDEDLRTVGHRGQWACLVALLEDPRANPSLAENILLRYAAFDGVVHMVKYLLGHPRFNPALGDNEALHRAAAHGHLEVVRILLDDARLIRTAESLRADRKYAHPAAKELLDRDPRMTEPPTADSAPEAK